MYGKRMPPVVENMLEHCQGCDLSKLTSVPYMKEALVQPKRVGEILSADTSLGVGYLEKPETHGNRAVLIIYLGHVCRNGAVDQRAHWGLVIDTKVITKFSSRYGCHT